MLPPVEQVRLGVAVSGGPDSLALLLLAHAAFTSGIAAATVDHGLRAESAAEARAVAEICSRLGVAHTTLPVTVAPGNVQGRARAARYAALGEWAQAQGLAAVLTAHHADDQAETLLMRLNRGSGVSGLAAVRAVRPLDDGGIALARPLLDWRKAELEEIVATAGLTPARDPANVDPRFDRARIRAELAEADWLDPLAIARSAQLLAQADSAIEWMVAQVWDSEVEQVEDGIRWAETDRPHLVTLGIAERAIVTCGGSRPGLGEVARLLADVRTGSRANLAGVLVNYRAGVWTFAPEPPRR